ncbi:U2 snRNP complex subunit [Martiniozyma asiatica (nom. inval.)]|nr:U2 snRNP complex subunit [Martiniozyma asiatica]
MGKYSNPNKIPPKNKPPTEYKSIVLPNLSKFSKEISLLINAPLAQTPQLRKESQFNLKKLHHDKNRFLYKLFYKDATITQQTWDWMVKWKIVDVALVAKWRKQGYENLCCLACIGSEGGKICICRVPLSVRKDLNEEGQADPCDKCACLGCSSGDLSDAESDQ